MPNFTNFGKIGDGKKKKSIASLNYLSINTYNTEYKVIIDSAKELGFKQRHVDPGLGPSPTLIQQV